MSVRHIVRGDFVTHKIFDYGVGRVAHHERPGLVWVAWIVSSAKWGAGLYKTTDLEPVGAPEPHQPRLGIDETDRRHKWIDLTKYIKFQ